MFGWGVAEDEGDALIGAEIGQPVPAEDALGPDDQVVAEGGDGLEEELRLAPELLVQPDLSLLVEDAEVEIAAMEIDADLLIKATKVDGVYDKDPVKYSDAVKFDRLTYDTVLKQGLRVMDAAGIALAKEDKKPILVMNMTVPGNVSKAVLGENVGTLISSE